MLDSIVRALLFVIPIAPAAAQVTDTVSVTPAGITGSAASTRPSLSADAGRIAFASASPNLVQGDANSLRDVFVRDRVAKLTRLVSRRFDGSQLKASANEPRISGDGWTVIFDTADSMVVPGDTNGVRDVFAVNLATGINECISVTTGGTSPNNSSYSPRTSFDGRFVAFTSVATDLVPGDDNLHEDVYLRDRLNQLTVLVSVAPNGSAGNSASFDPSLSADGRFVAFTSLANDLVAHDNNESTDVFVYDGATGQLEIAAWPQFEGSIFPIHPHEPSLSPDGRHLAFVSGGKFGSSHPYLPPKVVLKDRSTGIFTIVSLEDDESLIGDWVGRPSVSEGGRFVAFLRRKLGVGAGQEPRIQVVVRDVALGRTLVVSQPLDGLSLAADCSNPAIAGNGSAVVFEYPGSDLTLDDFNGQPDVFVFTPSGW